MALHRTQQSRLLFGNGVEELGVNEGHKVLVPPVPLMHTHRSRAIVIEDVAVLVSNLPVSVKRSLHFCRHSAVVRHRGDRAFSFEIMLGCI